MSVEKVYEHFFKPEVRKQGQEYFAQGLVQISNASDTQVQGFIKVSAGPKVTFYSTDIASPTFTVNCTCPVSSKGNFCKHIWAVLLVVESKYPDFLDSKNNIEKGSSESGSLGAKKESPFKAKQDDYRKQQYEKQKLRAKEQRQAIKQSKKTDQQRAKSSSAVSSLKLSADAEAAVKYFEDNGFSLGSPVSEELLRNAKRDLSRIFHPDKGGTHEESVTLNQHYEVLAALF